MSESEKFDLAFGEAHYNLFPELRYFTNGQAPFEDLEIYFKHQTGWPTDAATVITAVTAGPTFLLFRYVFGFGQGSSIGLVIGVFLFVNWLLLSLVIPKFRQRQIRAALRARRRSDSRERRNWSVSNSGSRIIAERSRSSVGS